MELGAQQPVLQVHPCGEKGSGVPPPPRTTEQLGTSHQRSSALPFPHTLPFLQHHGGSVGCSQTEWTSRWGASEPPWWPRPPLTGQVPFPGMCRFPTVRAPRSQMADVVSHLGFATCSAKSSQHPCASLSRQLPPRLLHSSIFRAGATCSASAGSGVLLPSPATKTPIYLLLLSFRLTLGLC